MRAHWFIPYLDTAALRISSSVCHVSDASHALTEVLSLTFFHTPPFTTRTILRACVYYSSEETRSCAPQEWLQLLLLLQRSAAAADAAAADAVPLQYRPH